MSWLSDFGDWADSSSGTGIIDEVSDFGQTYLQTDAEKYKAKQNAKAEVAKANAWASVANALSKNVLIIGCVIIVAIILKD